MDKRYACTQWDNDIMTDKSWTAVIDELAGGIIAYFAYEEEAKEYIRLLEQKGE